MINKKKLPISEKLLQPFQVVPLGLEPRLFGTKNRRVASYTIGQFHNVPAIQISSLRVQS